MFIGVYWHRYGQLVPGAQVSGLEEEFELSGGLTRIIMFFALLCILLPDAW